MVSSNKDNEDVETEKIIRHELKKSAINAYLKFFILSVIVSIFLIILTVVLLILLKGLFGIFFDLNWVLFMLSGIVFFIGGLFASFRSSITLSKLMHMLFDTKMINKETINRALRTGAFYFLTGVDLFILSFILEIKI